MAGFLHRPQGTDALPTAGSAARIDLAVRAVLRTDDGGVLVTSIERQPDGSFSGEVYGVTPRERHVAVGDRVTFGESQIFTYKTAGAEGTSREEVERAQMIRAFGESFRDAAAPNAEPAAAPTDFSFDAGSAPAARPADPPPPAAPAPAAAPRAAEPEGSVADAYAILRGAEPEPPASPQSPVEPIACMECGAALVVPVVDGQTPPKVSCERCGRINDVARPST